MYQSPRYDKQLGKIVSKEQDPERSPAEMTREHGKEACRILLQYRDYLYCRKKAYDEDPQRFKNTKWDEMDPLNDIDPAMKETVLYILSKNYPNLKKERLVGSEEIIC